MAIQQAAYVPLNTMENALLDQIDLMKKIGGKCDLSPAIKKNLADQVDAALVGVGFMTRYRYRSIMKESQCKFMERALKGLCDDHDIRRISEDEIYAAAMKIFHEHPRLSTQMTAYLYLYATTNKVLSEARMRETDGFKKLKSLRDHLEAFEVAHKA